MADRNDVAQLAGEIDSLIGLLESGDFTNVPRERENRLMALADQLLSVLLRDPVSLAELDLNLVGMVAAAEEIEKRRTIIHEKIADVRNRLSEIQRTLSELPKLREQRLAQAVSESEDRVLQRETELNAQEQELLRQEQDLERELLTLIELEESFPERQVKLDVEQQALDTFEAELEQRELSLRLRLALDSVTQPSKRR